MAPGGGDAVGIAADTATGGIVSGNLVRNSSPSASGILVTRSKKVSVTSNILEALDLGIVFSAGTSGTCQGNGFTAVTIPAVGVTCEP
jgi:nitrous oxidase accessory protein NosD